MHQIEPYTSWLNYYDSSFDERSPFYGKEYNYDLYSEAIYNHFIDPAWDFMGSETLYIKVLFANYLQGVVIIEMIGEWNDAINNDIMHLKRNIIEEFIAQGINKFILIGENVLNFHGSDDCYYEEWFDELEEGWIVALGFREHVHEEMAKFNVDSYLMYGGSLELYNWRTFAPQKLVSLIEQGVRHRIDLV